MAKKFRSLYLNEDLEYRLQQLAEEEDSSISRIVRIALELYMESEGFNENNVNDEHSALMEE